MLTLSASDVLFTRTQQKLLALLYGKPGESFYLNEIVRHAGIGRGTVMRELERMHAAGLLTLNSRGNQNHYQANAASPVYAELRGLVLKTVGLADVLRAALLPLADHITTAFVYGSIAKGEEGAGSDVDVMVVSEQLTYADVFAALETASITLGRVINPTVYTPVQFTRRSKDGSAFVKRVLEQPMIALYGQTNVQGVNNDKRAGKTVRQ